MMRIRWQPSKAVRLITLGVTMIALIFTLFSLAAYRHDDTNAAPGDDPTITSVTPNRGPSFGGQQIIVTVENLDLGIPGYAQDGLVAHYDGISNTRSGLNTGTTTWEDLSGNGNDMNLVGTLGASDWQQNGFLFTNNKYFTAPYASLSNIPFGSGPNTHEVNYNVTATSDDSAALFGYGASGVGQQGMQVDNYLGEAFYYTGGSTVAYWSSENARTVGTKRTLATRWNGSSVAGYNDGALDASTNFTGRNTAAGPLVVGMDASLSQPYAASNMIIRSVRIYNRALSDQEIACNAAVDRVRFDGSTTEDFSNCAKEIEIKVDNIECTNPQIIDGTRVTCNTPAHAIANDLDVQLTFGGQTVVSAGAYSYADPVISSVSPNEGLTAGGQEITITGNALDLVEAVQLGGAPCNNLSIVSDTEFTCTTSARAVGSVDVVVINADQTVTLEDGFTYKNPPPEITSITPNSGLTAGGTSVTISGEFVDSEFSLAKVEGGFYHAIALDSLGNLFTWGSGSRGAVGNGLSGDSNTILSPWRLNGGTGSGIANSTKFQTIAAGYYHSLAIDKEGNLYSWGQGTEGQIGKGSPLTDQLTPYKVNGGTGSGISESTKFKSVTGGTLHSLALDVEGNLYAWGNNDYGQIGNGTPGGSVPAPYKVNGGTGSGISAGTRFQKIAAGDGLSLAIDTEGSLYAWGNNDSGQIGNGAFGGIVSTPYKINGGAGSGVAESVRFRDLAGGHRNGLVIDVSGNLYTWGDNAYGQTGNGAPGPDQSTLWQVNGGTGSGIPASTKFSGVGAGSLHSFAIDAAGNLYTWGYNVYGQIGNGTSSEAPRSTLWQVNGGAGSGVGAATKFQMASGGYYNSYTVDTQGNLYSWGYNSTGQIGNGTVGGQQLAPLNITQFFPEITDAEYTVAFDGFPCTNVVRVDDNVITCTTPAHAAGSVDVVVTGADGQLSTLVDGYTYQNPLPEVTSITPNRGPAAGGTTVTIDGANFGGITEIAQTAGGGYHSMAIDTYGNLYTWGSNVYGQIGKGDTGGTQVLPYKVNGGANSGIPESTKFKAIAAGNYHSIAVDTAGNLYTWGDNTYGQIGKGSSGNPVYQSAPYKVNGGAGSGIADTVKFDLAAAGTSHSLAIDMDGNLYTWGINDGGQIGKGSSSSSVFQTTLYKVNGGAGSNVPDNVRFKAAAGGESHSLAIDTGGNLYTWGANGFGQIGSGTAAVPLSPFKINGAPSSGIPDTTKFDFVDAGAYHSVAIDADKNLYAWGRNNYGQVGDGSGANQYAPYKINGAAGSGIPGATKFQTMASGYNHALAIDVDGNLYSWGRNNDSQIGDGSTSNRYTPYQINGGVNSGISEDARFKFAGAGFFHSLVIDVNDELYAGGLNGAGQLGSGAAGASQPRLINVMASFPKVLPTVTFDDLECTDVQVVSTSQLTCVTPAHSAGLFDVTVTNPDSQSATLVEGFTYYDVPSAPRDLAAIPVDSGIRLNWTAPATNNYSAVTSYCYQYREVTEPAGSWIPSDATCLSTGNTDTTITFATDNSGTPGAPNISAGVTYEFRIAATNEAGNGPYTDAPYPSAQTLFITVSSSDVVGISATPNGGGRMSSTYSETVVKTNNSTGYNLTLSANDPTASGGRNLILTRDSSRVIQPMAANHLFPSSITGGSTSQWGWRVDGVASFGPGPTVAETDAVTSNFTWAGIPDKSVPVSISQSVSANATSQADPGTTTTTWFAVSINSVQVAGTYRTTVVYTAVTN